MMQLNYDAIIKKNMVFKKNAIQKLYRANKHLAI